MSFDEHRVNNACILFWLVQFKIALKTIFNGLSTKIIIERIQQYSQAITPGGLPKQAETESSKGAVAATRTPPGVAFSLSFACRVQFLPFSKTNCFGNPPTPRQLGMKVPSPQPIPALSQESKRNVRGRYYKGGPKVMAIWRYQPLPSKIL